MTCLSLWRPALTDDVKLKAIRIAARESLDLHHLKVWRKIGGRHAIFN
jgi:hypothetical protein